jgi:hypothetical protein
MNFLVELAIVWHDETISQYKVICGFEVLTCMDHI